MNKFGDIRQKLINGEIDIDSISRYASVIDGRVSFLIGAMKSDKYFEEIEDLIYLTLDYYAYGPGDVLITDTKYDMLMQLYESMGGDHIVYPDKFANGVTIERKQWEVKKHDAPFMVGNVKKTYNVNSLRKLIEARIAMIGTSNPSIIMAPKYDGISANIKLDVTSGKIKIVSALTRYDGVYGQDITKLVQNANNTKLFEAVNGVFASEGTYFAKVELLMSSVDFNTLTKLKGYSNRRSATSAIVGTPTNLEFAPYVTVMPLLIAIPAGKKGYSFMYCPESMKEIDMGDLDRIDKYADEMINDIRQPSFNYRIDGVVINVYDRERIWIPNDAMSNSIAYKINTNVGITTIEKAYMSVGRSGRATPMLRVQPCDVNETVVTDVSISNMRKFNSFEFCEGDTVVIVSAGDVIPQIQEVRKHNSDKKLKIEKECPYCGTKLRHKTVVSGEDSVDLYCMNDKCPRVTVGTVSNFFSKIGIKNISDQIINQIYEKYGFTEIKQYLSISKEELMNLEGFGERSAQNYLDEIADVRNKPVEAAKFVGALGIDGVAEGRCKKIFGLKSFAWFLDKAENSKHPERKIFNKILELEGFGCEMADKFAKEFVNRFTEIRDLKEFFTIIENRKMLGNIVFSGFRDPELAYKFKEMRIDSSENVNSDTIAVIASNMSSGKVERALKKGILVIPLENVEQYMMKIKDIVEEREEII